MSEIRATTISDAAGTGPITLTGQSAAKAWVNFNAKNTATIRDSFGVGSMVDAGTGEHTINLSSAMSNSGYSVTHSVNGYFVVSGAITEITAYTASSYLVRGINPQASWGNTDFETQSSAAHGDLA